MTGLPNPFLNSVECKPSTEGPVAVSAPPTLIGEAATEPNPVTSALADFALDGTEHIGEIFYYARKLIAEDKCFADGDRFVLDVERFMLDMEETPLFLQRAAE